MSLTARAFTLISLTTLLAILAIWSADPALAPLWLIPTALVLSGLAVEGFLIVRTPVTAVVEMPARVYLGRAAAAAFVFENGGRLPSVVEYIPAVPTGFSRLPGTRSLPLPAAASARDACQLIPERLGVHEWPGLSARLRGLFGLAWWSRRLPVKSQTVVAPDLFGAYTRQAAGESVGAARSQVSGSGAELKQLRDYQPGDPLHRLDWKATARRGLPVTREFIEDQHLEIVLAIDAGRTSRLHAGRLDRLGLFANVAARFAQFAVAQDDRVGLVAFADRTLAELAPARGMPAVMRIRAALEKLQARVAESSPLTVALRVREMVRHRSLVVMFTDPGEAAAAEELSRAIRLLQPRHYTVVATVVGEEADALARAPARSWLDPYVSLAAREREAALRGRISALRHLGASVVAAPAASLERAVLDEYRRLRRERRI